MSESRLPTVTVVIPTNGGRSEIIGRTLPVLLADPATNEVIVAFDCEDAATREIVDSHARSDDRLKAISTGGGEAPKQTGGQAARDAAIGVVRGEIVLALDDDVEPERELVSRHARRHAGSPDSLVVGYMPVSPLEDRDLSAAVRLYAEAYEQACSSFRADERSILTGFWAGNFSLPRERWLMAGRPAVELGYHDDREFGIRLLQTGVRGVFDPNLRAAHRYQRTRAQFLSDAQRSGRDYAHLHAAYPQLVPPPQESNQAFARVLVGFSRSRLGWTVMTRSLIALSRVLPEYPVMKLLRRIGFERGVREAG